MKKIKQLYVTLSRNHMHFNPQYVQYMNILQGNHFKHSFA